MARAVSHLTWLVVLGCGVPEDSGDTANGASVSTHLDAALGALPECERGTHDGRLDVEAGCADEACVGMRFADAEAKLGATSCFSLFDGAVCSWTGGLLLTFPDPDADGAPEPDARAFVLAVNPPWSGGTDRGLGLASSMRCFVDDLGSPELVSFRRTPDGEWLVRTMTFEDYFLSVYDFSGPDGKGPSDGLPDLLQFENRLFN